MYLCKTFFSLKYGTYSTEELVQAGMNAGANSLALTNINCTCDAWDFVQFCQQQQIKPILGVEIRNGRQHQALPDVFVIYPLGRKDPADLRKNELIGVLTDEPLKKGICEAF